MPLMAALVINKHLIIGYSNCDIILSTKSTQLATLVDTSRARKSASFHVKVLQTKYDKGCKL